MTVVITSDSPSSGDVGLLLERHAALMRATSPPQDCHYLDAAALDTPAVSFFSARENGVLLGVGAVVAIGPGHSEVKSMHTVSEARGRGIGRLMLTHLIAVARDRGDHRLSLETGSMAAFDPARRLYASEGFVECDAFGDYEPSPNSTFMTFLLSPGVGRGQPISLVSDE